jgi:hypothetical protein
MGKVKNLNQKFFDECQRLYEVGGSSAVIEFIEEAIRQGDNLFSSLALEVKYERCDACDNEMPSLNHECLICGQTTKPTPQSFLEELREEAQELIDLGDSREKAEGYGMMKVINAIRPMPTNLYFELIAVGNNEDLLREEIEINCGENGKIMIVKTDEGFVIDVYGQEDLVDTMAIWEDDINPPSEYDTDDDGNCQYCGQKCWEGQMCDEQQAGGFN